MKYDLEICHLPGKANGRADALPRRPDYNTGTRDNENVIILPEQLFIKATSIQTNKTPQDKDTLLPWVNSHNLKKVLNMWYKEGRRIITAFTGDLQEKCKVIKAHHDPPVYGHPGISKTMQIMEQSHWWPCMKVDIMEYIKRCAECQWHKVNNRPTKVPLQPIYPKPKAMPFETITPNFITKLPLSQGYDSILTITNHNCSKAAIFILCNEEINTEGMVVL